MSLVNIYKNDHGSLSGRIFGRTFTWIGRTFTWIVSISITHNHKVIP